ncbi:hypothetical protein EJ110_NYTH28955 [Nymphaea thermarum]|nr:hypothetical protein EJ110_NYTH28955 [Nymphaea thermarum]
MADRAATVVKFTAIVSSMTAIVNEKLKVEKEAASKNKPSEKKQLNMDKGDDDAVVTYEELDDYM